MCTAIAFKTQKNYFGRTLDYEHSFGEKIIITPRKYPFKFTDMPAVYTHFAIIGIGITAEDYPLYFDAVNEKGLGMAGLNFPGNAHYYEQLSNKKNISPFEFMPWVLSNCATVSQTLDFLKDINLVAINFSYQYKLSPLHWIISDAERSITVESVSEGLKIYENPIGVLTNNPAFDFHLTNLSNYMSLSKLEPQNNFCSTLELNPYSRGMGALGLPGDSSSASRFVRAAFIKCNSVCDCGEAESVSQFFHILGSVEQQNGCAQLCNGMFEKTLYTSCCNTDDGIYYYTTYENHQISAVDMKKEKLDSDSLICYPLIVKQQFKYQN